MMLKTIGLAALAGVGYSQMESTEAAPADCPHWGEEAVHNEYIKDSQYWNWYVSKSLTSRTNMQFIPGMCEPGDISGATSVMMTCGEGGYTVDWYGTGDCSGNIEETEWFNSSDIEGDQGDGGRYDWDCSSTLRYAEIRGAPGDASCSTGATYFIAVGACEAIWTPDPYPEPFNEDPAEFKPFIADASCTDTDFTWNIYYPTNELYMVDGPDQCFDDGAYVCSQGTATETCGHFIVDPESGAILYGRLDACVQGMMSTDSSGGGGSDSGALTHSVTFAFVALLAALLH